MGIYDRLAQRLGLGILGLDGCLIALALWRFPSSLGTTAQGWIGPAVSGLVLLGCALAIQLGLPSAARLHPASIRFGLAIAALLGVVFACQFFYEYLGGLNSAQDGFLANLTYGSGLLALFAGAFWRANRERNLRAGLVVGIWGGVYYSVVWVGLLWLTFHIFTGSIYENHFLEIDQALSDFQRSGMSDLRAFIVQDYLGASIFHPLLGAVAGLICGLLGGAAGRGLAALMDKKEKQITS